MFDYSLEHLFSYVVSVEKPQMIGPLPEGIRAIFYVTKGEITGPKLRGRFLPGGGDWLTVRTDGVGILDVRATLESDDGAIIYIAYTGVGDLGEGGYQKFLRGELPASLKLRVAPRFHTSHPKYLWLNRLQCLNIGEVDLQRLEVRYDVYMQYGDVSPAVGADRRATSSSRPGGGGRRRPKSWLDRNGRGLLMAPSLLGRPSSARNTFGTRHGFGVGCSAGASPGVAPDPLREPVNLVVGRRHS